MCVLERSIRRLVCEHLMTFFAFINNLLGGTTAEARSSVLVSFRALPLADEVIGWRRDIAAGMAGAATTPQGASSKAAQRHGAPKRRSAGLPQPIAGGLWFLLRRPFTFACCKPRIPFPAADRSIPLRCPSAIGGSRFGRETAPSFP